MKTSTDLPNCFGELLAILHDEELLRVRRRFQMRNNHRMAEILTFEIEQREALRHVV